MANITNLRIDGEIDAFVAWYPKENRLYWIDIEDAARKKMTLRDTAAIDHPAIDWAEEYELGDEIPP